LRDKIAAALVSADGRRFASLADARAFAETGLPFALGGTFGGHSACVELDVGSPEFFVCDLGSGARPFGESVFARAGKSPPTVNVFMSHVHWDHIMGFPFFGPAYVPGTVIRIHGCHDVLEQAFRLQQSEPCFPVLFDQLGARIEFVTLRPDESVVVSGVTVTPHRQRHSGDSYGYRFEHGGKVVVYSTDAEHKLDQPGELDDFARFFREADLVIFDAMYALEESISVKADWGHSSNIAGVALCQKARAKHLMLFHHEPANDDAVLQALLLEAREHEARTRDGPALAINAAYDGLEIVV
jgi:phosphoribosyl 1,2-cyclic phosphodiesterase